MEEKCHNFFQNNIVDKLKIHRRRYKIYLFGIVTIFSVLFFGAIRGTTNILILCTCVGTLALLLFYSARKRGSNYLLNKLNTRLATKKENPELLNSVKRYACHVCFAEPTVYITDDPHVTAISLGRSPRKAILLVNSRLCSLLEQDEIDAIVVHELHHIRNKDPLLRSILMWSVVLPIILPYGFFQMMVYGGPKNKFAYRLLLLGCLPYLPFFVGWVWTMVVLVRGVFFQQEYIADISTASITGKHLSLIRALSKLEPESGKLDHPSSKLQLFMYIIKPSLDKSSLPEFFFAHPPAVSRLQLLSDIAKCESVS